MATHITSALINSTRNLADTYGSDACSDNEVVDYLNFAQLELFELVLAAQGEDFFLKSQCFAVSTSNNVTSFSLSGLSLYKLVRVDLKVTDGYVPIKKVVRGMDKFRTDSVNYQFTSPVYDYRMNKIILYPNTQSTETIKIDYISKPTELDAGLNNYLDEGLDNWWEFLVVSAAANIVNKIEQDPSVLLAQKEALKALIVASKQSDVGGYSTVSDVEYASWSPNNLDQIFW